MMLTIATNIIITFKFLVISSLINLYPNTVPNKENKKLKTDAGKKMTCPFSIVYTNIKIK